MFLIALLAQAVPADLPPPALAQPIRAACMIDIAEATGQKSLLTQAKFRDAAERKASTLSSIVAEQARLIDEQLKLWPQVYDQKKDLFDHGLISQSEWNTFVEGNPDTGIGEAVKILRSYPNCQLLAEMNTPAATKIKAAAGQQ